jgi:hypothetical protein
MEFCRESEKSRGEVSVDIIWFRIVSWVSMQVDIGIFKARGVFWMNLIGLLSLGMSLKNLIISDL